MKHEISENLIEIFRMKLLEDEKSKATIDKYMKDVRMFFSCLLYTSPSPRDCS